MASLICVEHFRSIQGEGVWSGFPAYFIRLAGYNLACANCDTRGSWARDGTEIEVPVAAPMRAAAPRGVITGGEPLLQREAVVDLAGEVRRLHGRAHLESNGTIELSAEEAAAFSWITVSPKTPGGNHPLLPHADEVKVLCGPGAWLPEDIREFYERPMRNRKRLVVQPLDVEDEAQRRANVAAAVQVVTDIGTVHVSLGVQVHKLMGWR